ncbi:MAG TPA: cysteine desulfurase-like protein [Gemmatimonadales bacterium]
MTATVADIRRHFPALERRHGGHPVAYFDGPGGTQVPRGVVEAMSAYLFRHNANTHWDYPTSHETDAALAAAREALGDFLGARASEIAFGANMTTLTFHLARGLARAWGPGDEIVVTELDHHANVAPWTEAARDRGIAIRTVRMLPERGVLDWDDLERAIGPRTRLVAVGAASNALGTVTDVARVAAIARERGALTFVDAVHYAAHALVDVAALGCDFLACSPYKFCGPHLGVLFVRSGRGEGIAIPKLQPAPDDAPERFETGTLNHEGIVGAAAAVDFFASLAEGSSRRARLAAAVDTLHARGNALVERLWRGLSGVAGVRLYGVAPGQPRTPTVAFTVDGMSSRAVARALAGEGVFVSHGDFYAATVVERLAAGAEGLVRAGCACYTTEEEVDRLVGGVARMAGRPAAMSGAAR